MADYEPVIHTPLQHATFQGAGVVAGESLFCAKAVLRANFDDRQLTAKLEKTLGLPLDIAPNTFAQNEQASVFWLGPDERMVHAYQLEPQVLLGGLRECLPIGRASAVDVSDYYTMIRLAGVNARAVLAAGTPFDVHARHFTEGCCVQTRFGNASILLVMQDGSPAFDIQVRWSFADYVWRYIRRVAQFRSVVTPQ